MAPFGHWRCSGRSWARTVRNFSTFTPHGAWGGPGRARASVRISYVGNPYPRLFRRGHPIHRISFIDEGSGKSFARREPSTGVDTQSGGKIFRSHPIRSTIRTLIRKDSWPQCNCEWFASGTLHRPFSSLRSRRATLHRRGHGHVPRHIESTGHAPSGLGPGSSHHHESTSGCPGPASGSWQKCVHLEAAPVIVITSTARATDRDRALGQTAERIPADRNLFCR